MTVAPAILFPRMFHAVNEPWPLILLLQNMQELMTPQKYTLT